MWHIHTVAHSLPVKKRCAHTCYSTDESGWHDAKCKKTNTRTQIYYMVQFTENLQSRNRNRRQISGCLGLGCRLGNQE